MYLEYLDWFVITRGSEIAAKSIRPLICRHVAELHCISVVALQCIALQWAIIQSTRREQSELSDAGRGEQELLAGAGQEATYPVKLRVQWENKRYVFKDIKDIKGGGAGALSRSRAKGDISWPVLTSGSSERTKDIQRYQGVNFRVQQESKRYSKISRMYEESVLPGAGQKRGELGKP